MTKKEFGRAVAFILVACLMLILLCDLFELIDTSNFAKRFTTYEKLNKDTVDAVWIGTSGSDRYWIAAKAYEEYGMTVYPLATDAMPTWLFINVIEEAFAYQNPELIIIDLRAYGQNNKKSTTMDARARRVLDAMNFFSNNRLKAAFKTMDIMQQVTEEETAFELSYLLPYIKYHAKWAEDDYTFHENLGREEHAYLGFFMSKSLSIKEPNQKKVVYDAEYYEELDPIAEESLYELLDYAEEKGLNLLFVDTPQFKSKKEMGQANTVYTILDECGANYINYCETDEEGNFLYGLDLNPKKDFYNEGHVNYYGAEKFTAVFAKYLDENYDLVDRREDAAAQEDWSGVYEKLVKQIKKWSQQAAEAK